MKITFGILALSALLLFGSGCGDMQASPSAAKRADHRGKEHDDERTFHAKDAHQRGYGIACF